MSATTTKCPRCGGERLKRCTDGVMACCDCPYDSAIDNHAPPPAASGQVGGDHYGDPMTDTLAFARANFPPEQVEGFYRISAIKYLQRYDRKGGVEDVRKAADYAGRLIEHLEENRGNG